MGVALESVCVQIHDLLDAMGEDGVKPKYIKIDGGMVANNWVCQFLAGILNIEAERPNI